MAKNPQERLVSRAFELLLHRAPTPAELSRFESQVNDATGAVDLLEAIATCAEYQNSRAAPEGHGGCDLVDLLFQGFLDRHPSGEEAAHFAGLRESGARPEDLVLRLFSSAEFHARRRIRLYAPPGHFYSPVVNTDEARRVVPRDRPAVEISLPDVKIDLAAMESLWDTLVPVLRSTPFPFQKSGANRYYFDNPAFSFADSMMLRAMIIHFDPRRIVEVGSGFSSACTLDTVFDEAKRDCELTFIEPHPELLRDLMRPEDARRVTIISSPVQAVSLDVFRRLQSNDLLFIDSTHVVKTGSDVVHELTTILPNLAPGVIVHFHDVFYPFEYGYEWVVTENRSWNEIYALRAFLAFNSLFEIIFFNDMFGQLRRELIGRTAPDFLRNTGGSIWLRVRSDTGR
jgi:hypothetical protein